MRSLTDDDELLPLIEAIPDCFYDFSQNKVRKENVKHFEVLLDSTDPELNIWLRIGQFASKCGYWTDKFQMRSSQACVQAIWALVQVYTFRQRHDQFDIYLQFIRSVPSLLKIVATTSSGSNLCSALVTLGIHWMHLNKTSLIMQDLVLETFQAIAHHADTMSQISDASLYMLARDLNQDRPKAVDSIARMQASSQIMKDKKKIESILSRNKDGKTWHIIQIILLCNYLSTLRDLNTIPL